MQRVWLGRQQRIGRALGIVIFVSEKKIQGLLPPDTEGRYFASLLAKVLLSSHAEPPQKVESLPYPIYGKIPTFRLRKK